MIFSVLLALVLGICSGWVANSYWEKRVMRAKSAMALVSANEAAHARDWDKAIAYSTYALAYDPNSPLADIQLKEFAKKHSEKCGNDKSSVAN